MKASPGPWRDGATMTESIHSPEAGLVAIVYGLNAEQRRANAALIKLSPAMLEACKLAVELLESGANGAIVDTVWATPYETLRDRFVSLIEAVEGEQP